MFKYWYPIVGVIAIGTYATFLGNAYEPFGASTTRERIEGASTRARLGGGPWFFGGFHGGK